MDFQPPFSLMGSGLTFFSVPGRQRCQEETHRGGRFFFREAPCGFSTFFMIAIKRKGDVNGYISNDYSSGCHIKHDYIHL